MDINELNEIIAKETGLSICPICQMPYKPRHSRQKTCASEECVKAYRAEYHRERVSRLRTEDIDEFRKKQNEAQRKCRRKKKGLSTVDESLRKAQEYWERREAQFHTEKPDGKQYAERQIARTLSQVPKIDVSGFGKERKE